MSKLAKDATETKLLATLKRHNPHTVLAYNGDTDDEGRKIAVPTRRRKWASVISSIEARPWSRAELLDKSGAVLGYVDNDAGGGDLEELGPASYAGLGGQLLLAERIVAMNMRAVKEALSARESEVTALLTAQGGVLREVTNAVNALGSVYQAQNDAREDAADARAEAMMAAASAADGDQMKQLLDALPAIVQALPLLKNMLGAGKNTTS